MTIPPEIAFDVLRGNRPKEITEDIGMEMVNRAARLTLLSDLAPQLKIEQEKWRQSDLAIQELGMDVGVGVTELELFTPENIHEGPHKSLIEAPESAYPYISLGVHAAVPTGANTLDQLARYDMTLMVEAWVKSGAYVEATRLIQETVVHRRCLRTIEAVRTVINKSVNLHGVILPIQGGPRAVIHDMTTSQDGKNGGAFYRQGARLQYTLQRNSAL